MLVERVEPAGTGGHDPALLNVPATTVDVFVTSKAINGKTLRELADLPFARGVYLRRITRNLVEIPILPETEVLRGDILTTRGQHAPRRRGRQGAGIRRSTARCHGSDDRRGRYRGRRASSARSASTGAAFRSACRRPAARCSPVSLLGYFRAIRPTFGRIPTPALALMNTLGLNVFIAIVGINAGPGFVAGLQQVGLSLFVWGIVATSVPLIIAVLLGHYVFKFHPAILFGVCAGVRTTTAALGMIQDAAQEQGAGARIRDALRHRQHAAHDLRHGRRAAHAQGRLQPLTTARYSCIDRRDESEWTP